MITEPKIQITSSGQRKLPHCTLNTATVSGASSSSATMQKFEGFHKWRSFTRSTYFDMIERTLHNAYGQNAGERSRIPTLMPEMYALERFSHLPKKIFPRTSSVTSAATIASAVRSQLSRMPYAKWPTSRMQVMNNGGT